MRNRESGYKDLLVFNKAYQLALIISRLTKSFPSDERYLIVDQIRRSSRSICANIAEAYRKRQYVKYFISKISDADGEASETVIWLDFSKDLGYITEDQYNDLINRYREIGKMLGSMLKNPEKFLPRSR
jgi:four helix bundle protein